jgi:hypothetical protein
VSIAPKTEGGFGGIQSSVPANKKESATSSERACELIARTSVPIRQIGQDGFPVDNASSCLIDYGGRRWILTVHHATSNLGDWRIEMTYDEGKGLLTYSIGVMTFFKLADLSAGTVADLDMAFAPVPNDLKPYYEPRDEQAKVVKRMPRFVFKPDLHYKPSARKQYSFAGGVMPTKETHFGQLYQGTKLACYRGLKYVGEDKMFYVFKLPFQHPGHDFFRGTSGSPIIDTKRNIAALVVGPGNEPDTIKGIKIGFFRAGLDAELAQLKVANAPQPRAPKMP